VIRRREKEPEGDGRPLGHARIISPYDNEARPGAKPEQYWLGYKLHIIETCDNARRVTAVRLAWRARPAPGSTAGLWAWCSAIWSPTWPPPTPR
jgi:hypothetical protein